MTHPDTTRLQQAVWRLEDILKDDDGQAWKEASKFLERLKKEQREEAKPAAPVVWPEPDMFWDDKDRDNCLDSIAEVVAAASYNRGVEIGDEILICRALNLPVITIRITKVSDEDGELALEWEQNDY